MREKNLKKNVILIFLLIFFQFFIPCTSGIKSIKDNKFDFVCDFGKEKNNIKEFYTTNIKLSFQEQLSPIPKITNPTNGSWVTDLVNITVNVTDPTGNGIEKVVFYIDNYARGIDVDDPYFWIWDTVLESNSPHIIKVAAFDYLGNAQTHHVTVFVENRETQLTIEPLSTGIGIFTNLKNIGNYTAVDINWNVSVEGGLHFFSPKYKSNIMNNLGAGSTSKIGMLVLGLGLGIKEDIPLVTIKIQAGNSNLISLKTPVLVLLFMIIVSS